jgi:hypothetical protein
MNTKVVPNPEQKGWEPDGTTTDGTPIYKWESGGGTGGSLWTDNGDGSISYDGTVKVNGKNGKGLHFELAGSSDYVIQESTSSDTIRFGGGAVTDFTHNISSGNVTVTGDLLAAKAGAGDRAFSAGTGAGASGQGAFAVALGASAGKTNQTDNAVAVGVNAGKTSQGNSGVAVGNGSGTSGQSDNATAVGALSGETDQGEFALAVGYLAGQYDQDEYSVAVGAGAGKTNQSDRSVAVGPSAGFTGQGAGTVAIGYLAGETNQSGSSIAIGNRAGQNNQAANSIVINSSGVAYNVSLPNSCSIYMGTGKYLEYNGTNAWTFGGGTVNGLNGFRQNGAPVIDAKGLISALSTLRNATKDETTLDGLRDALSDAIGGLIEKLEHEIGTQEIPE